MNGIVVMLTALPMEYQALQSQLTELEERVHPKGTIFEVGRLADSEWKVAVAEIGEGNRSAAIITERAHSWLEPDALFFVGIAGGLKPDIALGDVVVATKVYGYHGGGQTCSGFQARPAAWEASHRLEQAARAALRNPRWTRRLPAAGVDPRAPYPVVHFKPIAAGEVVLDEAHGTLAGRLTHHYNDAVAIEMESAGVAHAAHLSGELQTLTIRGISDKADGKKHRADSAGSQARAATHAAAAAFAVLDHLTFAHPAPSISEKRSSRRGSHIDNTGAITETTPYHTPPSPTDAARMPPAEARRLDTGAALVPAVAGMGAGSDANRILGAQSESPARHSRQAGPALARILVGRRLRRLRKASGFTREAAGKAIRSSNSKIRRLELGQIGVKPRDVAHLLALYGVSDGVERANWLDLAELTNARSWLHDYRDIVPNRVGTRLELERDASLIRSYEAQFIPALVQTLDYCRLVTRLGHPGAPRHQVERYVSLQSKRRQLLHGPRPPVLWAVIDESALRRQLEDTATMRSQLKHLLEISELPHVTLQVMPFRTGVAAGGTITLLRFADRELPDVIYLDQLTNALYLDRPADIDHYHHVIDRMSARAEPAAATITILHQILKET